MAFSLEGKLDDDNTVSGKWNSYTDMNKTAFTMRAGTWSFTMHAYAKTENGEPSNEPMLYSTITKKIVEGSNSLDFTMKVCETGYGSFSMDLTFNKTVTKVEATLCKMDKTPVTAEDLGQNYDSSSCGEITQTWTGEDLSEGKVTYEIKNILKGNYTLSFTLTEGSGDNAKTVSYDELAKVVPGTSSSGNYDISDTNKEITRYYAVYYEDGVEDEEIKVPEDNTLYKYGQKIFLKFPPEEEGAETENELLKRDGWEFIGWQYKKTLFERNGLGEIVISEDINEEEIHLVAAWVREGNKTVIYFHGNGGKAKMNDGSIVELYEQTGEKEKPIDLWPCNFERTGFEFLGWTEDEEAAEVTIKDQAQLSFTVDTTHLYAVWQPGYVVKYMQQNTDCNGYTEDASKRETKYGKAGETVAVTKNASLYEGFTLVDFELPTIAADGSTEVILYYDRNIYTLSYDDGVENETISVPDSKEYPYGASVDLTTVTVPTRTGYNFGGWLLDTDLLDEEFTMPAENTVLTAKWNVKDGIEYTVRYYLQMVDANDYVEDEKALYTGSGKTGEDTNASPKTYAGFHHREFSQEPIKADGSTEIKIYYDRNMHSVSYNLNGVGEDEGEDSLEVPEKKDYRFGTMDIPVNFPDSYKNFAGYEFLGWAKKPWEVIATRKESEADYIESGTKSFTMEDSDLVLYAVWKPRSDVTYTVEHKGQKLDPATNEPKKDENGNYIYYVIKTVTQKGQTGTDTSAEPVTIIGFTKESVENKPISRKGDTVIEYLYTRNKYTLKYDQNMPKEWTEDPERHADDVSVPESASYRFESVVPYATATINDEDGYDFSGWATSANAEAANYSENFKLDADLVARANKDNEITLYAVWNPKDITYKVEHYKQNIDDDNYTLIEPVSTENASAWTSVDAADKKIEIEGFEYASKVDVKLNPHADNNVAKIYYNRLTASLTYDANGGSLPYNANGGSETTNSKTYRYGKVVDLNFAGVSRKGYDFLGWASAKEAPELEYTSDGKNTITMGTENVTLYAVWTESTYTLKYDLNLPKALAADGRANITAPDDDSKKYLTTVTYTPATINDEDGYTFLGWAKASDATEPQYTKDFPVDANLVPSDDSKTITLYAVWKAQEIKYTVKYWQQKLDAGTDFNKDEYTEVSSASETLKAEVWTTTAVTAAAGKFTGFEPLKTDNVTINPHMQNVVNVYYNRVEHKVIYDANANGEGGIYTPKDRTERYGKEVELDFAAMDLNSEGRKNRPGYNFKGWATSADESEPDYYEASDGKDGKISYTMEDSDVTLYAVWEARSDTSYTVEHYQQKLDAKANFDQYDYELVSNDTAELTGKTADNTVAVENSYLGFTEGFTVGNEPGKITQEKIAGNESTVIRIYYNRKTYTLHYDVNATADWYGTSASVPADSSESYRFGATVTPSYEMGGKRTGYSFMGWDTEKTATEASYKKADETSFVIDGDIYSKADSSNVLTLYAVWTANAVSGSSGGIDITTPEYPESGNDKELIQSTVVAADGNSVTFTVKTWNFTNCIYKWYVNGEDAGSIDCRDNSLVISDGCNFSAPSEPGEDGFVTITWDTSSLGPDRYDLSLTLTGYDKTELERHSQQIYINIEK
ncbi:InlB B-repeat-containing protein [uncultured Treponema sp.]|uniref:InlB B-repeat-containing protein n=1 Tax=uncultured Treponema sp. TaxID=162155 RepID=UPI00263255F0|nr:InlB B-repeat-containing protein [uncultured Treponema sp.]